MASVRFVHGTLPSAMKMKAQRHRDHCDFWEQLIIVIALIPV